MDAVATWIPGSSARVLPIAVSCRDHGNFLVSFGAAIDWTASHSTAKIVDAPFRTSAVDRDFESSHLEIFSRRSAPSDLVNTYIYLGSGSLLSFVNLAGQRLLKPFRWIPLRIGPVDFLPLALVAALFLAAQFATSGLLWLYLRLP